MNSAGRGEAADAAEARHHGSPEGKVIGAFEPSRVDEVIAALTAEGFAADQIDIVTSDDLEDLEAPLDRPGLRGLVGRFLLSMGDELDELERARQELAGGHVLIGVPARGEEAVHRIRDIMREHGGHAIIRFGRWTITDFE